VNKDDLISLGAAILLSQRAGRSPSGWKTLGGQNCWKQQLLERNMQAKGLSQGTSERADCAQKGHAGCPKIVADLSLRVLRVRIG